MSGGAIESLLGGLTAAGAAVWRASWQASVLAGLVLAVQLVFGRRIAPRWRHAMWVLVLVRLALPAVPRSPVSVFNLPPLRGEPAAVAPPQPTGLMSTAEFAAEMHARAERFTPREAAAVELPPALAADVPAERPHGLREGWPQAVAAAWAAGVVLLALRVARATLGVSHAVRRLGRVTDEPVLAVLRDAAAELRVRRLPLLLTGDGLFSPALVGFVRPRLLLPRGLLARFDPAELRLVLLHELAHLKRRDVLVNWLATLLTVLHWPNPVAWLVAWRLRLERELATDELVLSRTTSDADRRAYGHTIVKLLETFSRAGGPRPVPAGGVGILEGRQQMKRRITMIARFATRSRTWTVVAAALVLGLGAVALTDAAQQPAADARPVEAKPAAPASRPVKVESPSAEDAELAAMERRRAELAGSSQADPFRQTDLKILDAKINQRRAELALLRRQPDGPITRDELVTVSVMDLAGPGVETVKTARPDRDGNISLPYVGKVKAVGLTSAELEQAVAKAYQDKKLIQNAMVAVSLPDRGESHRLSNKAQPAAPADPAMGAPGMEGMGMDPLGGMMGEAGMMGEGGPPVDPAMQAVLDRKIPEVEFDGVPLSDVVDFLRDVTAANVFVDWRALEAAGIERNAPVSARLRDVAFKDALAVILRGVDHSLRFTIENGVLNIGVAAGQRKPAEVVVRAYEVEDLIQMAGDPKTAAAELAKVISGTVQPDFWRTAGGAGQGTVGAFGNKVVVTATEPVHREVEALLKVLREPSKDAVRAQDMTVEQIAQIDQQMAQHLQMKQEIALKIEQLKLSGRQENSPEMKPVLDSMKIREDLIQQRRAWFAEKYKGYRFTPDGGRLRGPTADEKAEAEALWREKYAPLVINVNGQTNEAQLREEFNAELAKREADREASQAK